jgi:hypothetical protein
MGASSLPRAWRVVASALLLLVSLPVHGAKPGPGGPGVCSSEPLDLSRFELIGTLNDLTNGVATFGPNLGVSVSLASATLSLPGPDSRTVLVAAVGTPRTTGRVEFFVLDATTGAVLDGQPLCDSCAAQSHLSVPVPSSPGEQAGSGHMSKGDVNADGIPDFAVSDHGTGSAAVFVGSVTPDGRLQYAGVLLPRPSSAGFGYGVAVGDLDGTAGDEIAVSRIASGSGKRATPAAIHLYRVQGLSAPMYQTLSPNIAPALKSDDAYGWDIAIGDVTHDGRPDLAVAVPLREIGGITNAGAVFVHIGAGATPPFAPSAAPLVLSATVPTANDSFGIRVAAANADSSGLLDVVATTDLQDSRRGEVFSGPTNATSPLNPNFTFQPRPGLDANWAQRAPQAADLNADGLTDLVMGLPGVATSGGSCPLQGMVYVFLGQAGGGWVRLTIQGPYDSNGGTFGYGFAVAEGYPFIVVGNNQFNIANESTPGGQAFVYRVKNP